jgi:hypothetical protein
MSTEMPDPIHLLPSILSPTTSYPIAGMSRSQISHRLPPIPFALNTQHAPDTANPNTPIRIQMLVQQDLRHQR